MGRPKIEIESEVTRGPDGYGLRGSHHKRVTRDLVIPGLIHGPLGFVFEPLHGDTEPCEFSRTHEREIRRVFGHCKWTI